MKFLYPRPHFSPLTPNFDPVSPDHYTSEDFIRKGIIAELFEQVPVNLHEKMQGSGAFRDLASYSHFPLSLY